MTRLPRPKPLYWTIAAFSWPIMHVLFRYRASGTEHLPARGGYVLAAGHFSNFDPWPLGLALWPRRFLRFMAKAELFWFPLSAALDGVGAFKVHRGIADRRALETAVELAREGHVVAMFPEGTRRAKGLNKRFESGAHTGAARIARRANVPLIPAGLRGTDRLSRFGPLRVAYGEPIPIGDNLAETTERLMRAIRELEESLQ